MTKVSIKNFQSISNIDFDIQGFTVIVGKNNIGKSAVVRSINSALTNASGKDFIKKGTKNTEVSLKRDKLDIYWKKGSKVSYIINDQSYSSLKGSIPKPLQDAGFQEIKIGDKKINPLLAPQFDPLFLLNKTGSTITEILSAMYKLNIISCADDICLKQLRSTKSLHKTRTLDLENVQKDLEKYKDFENIKKLLNKIKDLNKKREQIETEIEEINSYEKKLKETVFIINSLKRIDGVKIPETQKYELMTEEFKWISEKNTEINQLYTDIKKLRNLRNFSIPDYKEIEKELSNLAKITSWYHTLKNQTDIVENQKKALNELNKINTQLKSFYKNTEKTIEENIWLINIENEFELLLKKVRASREELKEKEKKLKSVKEEYSKIGICPFCERPF